MKSCDKYRAQIGLTIVISLWSCFTIKAQRFPINSKECGLSQPLGRVINGSITWRAQVPWLVHIFAVSRKGHGTPCGGSLITRDVVMTAAHCVYKTFTGGRVVVYYNTTTRYDDKHIDVEQAVIHRKYKHLDSGYNIALLKLARPLMHFDSFVRPVCLPKQGERTKARKMVIAGFGDTDMHHGPPDRIFYYRANVLSDSSCAHAISKQWWTISPRVRKLFMCSKNSRETAYQGDSGDPVTTYVGGKSVQYGIVTFGQKKNRGLAPVVHTRVSMFIKWINKVLQKLD
ncbi:mast cell protease 4-like [Dermacentor andersoni]|uniref:mast cell protease 4-like n=1 Tax=Dermacentor andersoni TaxID=34620 RepID=UPI002155F3A1|nr:mast cell protease 4-like [Dermacentor andersoni]